MHRSIAAACFMLCCCALSCTSAPRRDEVEVSTTRAEVTAALERYVEASRVLNADAMTDFFDANAVLFEPGIHPVETKNAIRAFLKSFPGAQVEIATATPERIDVWEGAAIMWGSYFERLSFPGQPMSAQHGKFVIQWKRHQDGQWLMERYFRVPLPDDPRFAGE